MSIPSRIFSVLLLALSALLAVPAYAQEDDPAAVSPLRLSYLEGDVAFWRYGAEDWTDARLNTPLAAGDALYVDGEGSLELQLGSRAFIRASDDTELSVVNQTVDFLQLKVTSGRASLDLRSLPSGYAIELNTPNSVFTIERAGYYRVEVNGDVHFITRRGGQATMVPAGGRAMSIYPSEEIVVEGTTVARAETYVAPELDSWDRWNYERTEDLIEVASERYLSSDIAGASDLDRYGRWRVVANYGTVWVPDGVAYGWAPYSTGRWVWDPYYQWTWIDDAPWGWAPFHYGRWVYVSGYWAWAPGPVVRRAVYSPALVAFYGVGSGVSITIGGSIGWVALSWGEPIIPWWGRSHFIGRPYWGGWGGPRIVNNVVVKNTTIINVNNIQYVNTRVNNALVATPTEKFGKGYVQTAPAPIVQTEKHKPLRGALPVKPEAASVTVGSPGKVRPPDNVLTKPVVATRPPREAKLPWGGGAPKTETRIVKPDAADVKSAPRAKPEERYITVPKRSLKEPGRPQFGERAGEERPRPPEPPGFTQKREEAIQREAPPPFESRVREQRDEERRVKPLKEFREAPAPRETTKESPRETRQFNQPRDRDTSEQREAPQSAMPGAMPRTDREEVPQRMRREPERDRPAGVERPQPMPERERAAPAARERAPEPERRVASPPGRTEREEAPQRMMREPERERPAAVERPQPMPQREQAAPVRKSASEAEKPVLTAPPARAERETMREDARKEGRGERADLPGNPANRMYRGSEKKQKSQQQEQQPLPGRGNH